MVAIGFVLFISFVVCVIAIFGLLTNCLFEFGIDPAIKRFINWNNLTFGKKYVSIVVHPATMEQLDLATKQEVEFLGLESAHGVKMSLKQCDDYFGGLTIEVPADEPLPDNFVRYTEPIRKL